MTHIILKLSKGKYKEVILKSARKTTATNKQTNKQKTCYIQRKLQKFIADFSAKNLQTSQKGVM